MTRAPQTNLSGIAASGPWWRELNKYHWFVLLVAALGWMFDTMDQQLFTLARVPAMTELLAPSPGVLPDPRMVSKFGALATSIFLIGWATGGLAFGVLGDRIGRAKTMLITILMYSICTGLSALSTGFWDFAFYRFVTGLGVGGEFAVGVALVAEVMPDRARPYAIGLLQALSAVGNITAAGISIGLGVLQTSGTIVGAWRIMFLIGALPAFLAVFIRRRLKEPERWKAVAVGRSARLGSYGELFGTPRLRKNALVGLLLAFSGVVGLWGIGFFIPDLFRSVFQKAFQAEGLAPAQIAGKLSVWTGLTLVMLNVGGFFGIYCFGLISQRIGRKPTFAFAYVAAMLSTAMVFAFLKDLSDIFWMVPIMGFCQLSLFGGFAIYFPELFPTRLRSTGTSFCYNVGRFVAAVGPAALGYLTSEVYRDQAEPLRYAGLTMCGVFFIGLMVLPWAPETRGKPLPED